MSTNLRFGLALVAGVGLAGCGSGSHNASDGVASLPDGAAFLADSVASRPDDAATGLDAAGPVSVDVGNASEAGAAADRPNVGLEAGHETAVAPADASVDMASAPLDVAFANDSLPVTPDAATAEAVVRMDATEALSSPDAVEAGKPADSMAVDSAGPATDLGPATLGELSPQQLNAALASKDFLLIDVHFPNAGSIPDTKVVLTCLMGGMSRSAGDALVARGYRNVSELTGGMNAWTQAGYKLVRLDGGM